MWDGSGDGKKWKLERCLGGPINGSWREVGFGGRVQRLSDGCLGSGLGKLGERAFNGARDVLATDVPQSGLVRVSHM